MKAVSRRQFVQGAGVAGLGLLAGCGRPFGQSPTAKTYRIGFLRNGPIESRARPVTGVSGLSTIDAFLQSLQEYGYVDGQNLRIEWRTTPEAEPRLSELVKELVALPVDLLLVAGIGGGAGPALAAKRATQTLPIVLMGGGDPVALGLVDSLARPGGNITGVTADVQGGLLVKRLEILKEAAPGVLRVAIVEDTSLAASGSVLAARQGAAEALGLQIQPLLVSTPEELEPSFDRAVQAGANGLLLVEQPSMLAVRGRIAELAQSRHLPSVGQFREFPAVGGLISYGPDLVAMYRRGAYYVDRILKGTKPADLPVEQPREFEFVINLKTAQALGLTIPQHVLLQATEIIQ